MAAELVLCDNLEMTLNGPAVASLLPLEKELKKLLQVVIGARGPLADLVRHNHTHLSLGNIAACWLENLSALVYEADDLLDQIITFNQPNGLCGDTGEGNERQNHSRLIRSIQKVRLLLSPSNLFIHSKVTAGRVEKITKDIENLVKMLLDENGCTIQPDQTDFRYVGSIEPDQHTMTARQNDKNNILNMLQIKPYIKVSVICITGLPGVGKSALAKNIYDDQEIKNYFDLRIWIQASQITNENEIIRGIVESCTTRRSSYQYSKDRNPFRDLLGCQSTSITTNSPSYGSPRRDIDINERLRREIRGKLYLLILDDVCLEEWQCLRELLAEGAPGSGILITTRSVKTADLVKRQFIGVMAYPLQGLTENHSWNLFKRHAFEEPFGDKQMRQAGSEIIAQCDHVPLTIKIAASFLYGKSREEWLSFTRRLRLSPYQGEDILEHVLHLSYSDLPPRLRASFVYCSLFPDDYTFNKQDLISLWIAQGYVDPDVDPQRSLERAGEMYFMELSRRCFFEDVRTDDLGNILTCKMHRIMRELASIFTTGVAPIHVTACGTIQITDPTTKHASVNCRSDSSLKLSPLLNNCPRLRSLIFVKEPDCNITMDNLISTQLISACRRLRVLDLHDLGLKQLPDCIGDQIHLRYLDVSKNHRLVTVPKSLTRLCNLQTLKLNSCHNLIRLPIDFGLLVNLNRFEVDKCERLTCMPKGLEKLKQLETLSRFVVSKEVSKETGPVGLKALSKLKLLRGRLLIHFTGDWMRNRAEITEALCTKENLVEVKIIWVRRTSDAQIPLKEEISAHEKTLEELKPNEALKSLYIRGYKGNDFPNWANKQITSCLPYLVNISIEGCDNCQYLPPFWELAHLKKLTLRNMANVQFVEETAPRRYEPDQKPLFFPSLQEFTLHNFYNLERWRQEFVVEEPDTRSFPCLSKLRIWNCPKLKSFPPFTGELDLDLQNVNHWLRTKFKDTEPKPKNKVYTRILEAFKSRVVSA